MSATAQSFDPAAYGPFASLLSGDRLTPLGPGEPRAAAQDDLAALDPAAAFGPDADPNLAQACVSGAWLLHNYLDKSHTLSQAIETADGSFWHGIMHRREPDAPNAKYWFRSVGDHPVYAALAAEAKALAQASPDAPSALLADTWDPYAFIDLCEAARGTGSPLEALCMEVQRREWELLFDHCWHGAKG